MTTRVASEARVKAMVLAGQCNEAAATRLLGGMEGLSDEQAAAMVKAAGGPDKKVAPPVTLIDQDKKKDKPSG